MSTVLTTIASIAIPAARAVAKVFTSVTGTVASATKARKRISAAEVTSLPVVANPSSTAREFDPVSSHTSRMRVRMKTS